MDGEKAEWKPLASPPAKAIYRQWRHTAFPESSVFPYEISLTANEGESTPPPPFNAPHVRERIVITEAYENTFLRILTHRRRTARGDGGVVLTGQAGIGLSPPTRLWSGPTPTSSFSSAKIWGLLLWSYEELLRGYVAAALELLRKKQKNNLVYPADDDVSMPREASSRNPASLVDEAIELSLDNATIKYGFAPHDVYAAVFDPAAAKLAQDDALATLDYADLLHLARTYGFSYSLGEDRSQLHRIVAVQPKQYTAMDHTWDVDFKSAQIKGDVVQGLMREDGTRPLQLYSNFCSVRVSTSMASIPYLFGFAVDAPEVQSVQQCKRCSADSSYVPPFSLVEFTM
ncbi:hypothetical protein BDW22DRAFT_1487402 [Trametopsis cervina]|nr:hypothetical protein BDW22DRAFT_1487402 [Trametopsis cervina]